MRYNAIGWNFVGLAFCSEWHICVFFVKNEWLIFCLVLGKNTSNFYALLPTLNCTSIQFKQIALIEESMEKLGKSSNNKPQKQPAKQAKKGKDIEIIEIEVDSNLLFICGQSKYSLVSNYMLFASTAICRLASIYDDLLLLSSDSDCKKVKSKNRRKKENIMSAPNLLASQFAVSTDSSVDRRGLVGAAVHPS